MNSMSGVTVESIVDQTSSTETTAETFAELHDRIWRQYSSDQSEVMDMGSTYKYSEGETPEKGDYRIESEFTLRLRALEEKRLEQACTLSDAFVNHGQLSGTIEEGRLVEDLTYLTANLQIDHGRSYVTYANSGGRYESGKVCYAHLITGPRTRMAIALQTHLLIGNGSDSPKAKNLLKALQLKWDYEQHR